MREDRDPHIALTQALLLKLAPARLTGSSSAPWASITFSGARHRFRVALDGPNAEHRAAQFNDNAALEEFALHGHLLADIISRKCAPQSGGALLELEALTVQAL